MIDSVSSFLLYFFFSKNLKTIYSNNSGWFGGIWNKLSLKPKNQMILPDDKNPTILWDPEKKKWVNTDGGEDESSDFKPPPKMSDLSAAMNQSGHAFNSNFPPTTNAPPSTNGPPMGVQQTPQFNSMPGVENAGDALTMQSNGVSNMADGQAKIPNLQSNMFKMQRNRSEYCAPISLLILWVTKYFIWTISALKKSYVDVFNPSGAAPKAIESVPPPLNHLPPLPQSGFFIPGAVPASQENDVRYKFYFFYIFSYLLSTTRI